MTTSARRLAPRLLRCECSRPQPSRKGRLTMKRAVTALSVGLYLAAVTGCAAPPPPPGAAYGSREAQCHEWAKQQTGWDTAKGAGVGLAVGALAGAAGGAAIGAATGNAGRGAAIGAASGAV